MGNRRRFQPERTWKSREKCGHDRLDLRRDIERKKTERVDIPEYKNDEKLKKSEHFVDSRENDDGQNFR